MEYVGLLVKVVAKARLWDILPEMHVLELKRPVLIRVTYGDLLPRLDGFSSPHLVAG